MKRSIQRAPRYQSRTQQINRPAIRQRQFVGKSFYVWVPCILALCVYLPSLTSEFIRDDQWQIGRNPQVQAWEYFPRLLTTHLWSQAGAGRSVNFYRPLFSVWMLLVYTVGGLSPVFWHLSSILLHGVATYFVFRLCKLLLENDLAAAFAAALFAIDPIHVDAVSWVSASCEILFSIFSLAAILLLAKGDEGTRPNPLHLLASVGLYLAALFAKETAVAVLPIFVIIAYVRFEEGLHRRDRLRGAAKIGTWYLLSVSFYLGCRWMVLSGFGLEFAKHTWPETLYSGPSILVFYLGKLVCPVALSGFYVNSLISAPTVGMWLMLISIMAGTALLVWLAIRYSPIVAVAGALILFPLIPTVLGIRVYDQGDMTHDRYVYLPSVGLCLLIGYLTKSLWEYADKARPPWLALCVLVLAAGSYSTLIQQRFYKNNEAFYMRGIEVNPSNVLAIDYLGDSYLSEGRTAEAMEQFRRAYQLVPNDSGTVFSLARGLFETHQYVEARPLLKELENSSNLEPDKKKRILLSLADVEIVLNNLSEAEQALDRLGEVDPRFPGLHRTLAIVLQRHGRIAEAQAEYANEFKISGDQQSGQQAIALAQYLRGKP